MKAADRLMDALAQLQPREDGYASQVVDALLEFAARDRASDIHIEKGCRGIKLRLRWMGTLIEIGEIPDGASAQVIPRVKALARLISYRNDIPQEGRFQFQGSSRLLEARVSTLPLIDGERAVIRLAADSTVQLLPHQLGFSDAVLGRLLGAANQKSGVILITGQSGAGKTTTAYAVLRHLSSPTSGPRSLVSMEDPVEAIVDGVSQSQINPAVGFTWEEGLRAILRQDPEVLLIGEIRDNETARLVFQAAMTGQLVISTMHSRSAAESVRRLLDMQVPVHHLVSSLLFLCCQRLRCRDYSLETSAEGGSSTQADPTMERQLDCELLPPLESGLTQAIIKGAGGIEIEWAARQLGMTPFAE